MVSAPPSVMGSRILVPLARPSGTGTPAGLALLQPGERRTGAGRPRWIHEDPAGVHQSPVVIGDDDDGLVVFTTGIPGGDLPRAVKVARLGDGSILQQLAITPDATGILRVLDSGHVLVGDRAEDLSLLDRETGRLLAAPFGPVQPDLSPMFVGEDLLVSAADGGLVRLLLEPGDAARPGELHPQVWADVSWVGTPVAPPVVFRAGILIPRAGWGLVSVEAGP